MTLPVWAGSSVCPPPGVTFTIHGLTRVSLGFLISFILLWLEKIIQEVLSEEVPQDFKLDSFPGSGRWVLSHSWVSWTKQGRHRSYWVSSVPCPDLLSSTHFLPERHQVKPALPFPLVFSWSPDWTQARTLFICNRSPLHAQRIPGQSTCL